MKNLITIILLVTAFISCKKEGNIQISGNLKGVFTDTIILTPRSHPLNQVAPIAETIIPVSGDGSFSYEFKGKADYYFISCKTKSELMPYPLDLYLQPKQRIQINFHT